MIGLKIPKDIANDVRKSLLKNSLINLDFKIEREKDYVIIPLLNEPKMDLFSEICQDKCEIIDTDFEMQKRSPRSLKEYLEGKIDPKKIEEIRGSFDIIGDIVILEIPEDLDEYKHLIGEAALKFTGRKAVFKKQSEIKGIIRTRDLEHIAGEDISETVHQEFGCKLMLDVKKVYFSPRLATERKRVADQVQDGEIIVDMFAGVAPFPVLIAKNHNVKIYAIDINNDAYEYIKRNMELNKVSDKIIPISGDVREVLGDKNIRADRIIMNLPGTAYEFLDSAIETVNEGGIVHYYEFSDDFQKPVERIKIAAYPRKIEVLGKRKVRSRSPGMWHMGIDARIF
ncbi:MAG: class I SAM-dependent methyltransferase family protein [Methanobacterium sp.]|uniref:class I SAM-dependent methyltransferase n=1 Tax=Methanobacterium sp. TaxID=2164 RepID=UPI003D65F424|nr:class I SAM-dependent methyltransferase family protein [Methanobacterium sp.]